MTHLRTVLTAASLALITPLSLAHEGHGLPGAAHWHATDVLGFIAVGAVAVALIWFKGRK
ncbi:hypothetical protein GTZ97_03940 [Aquabacterium fontiphilum]|jgi:hypothetical protein|uniref:hypothetical protein n=1 Tax=Aquabacterium fontiphilum TaxID=450365 RepID=UPI001377F03B|nr:hypothetical protein [Aquabacterium fontiphilum]NBD19822.1 hypothetical protein [Aquabacterium fontiphilum]